MIFIWAIMAEIKSHFGRNPVRGGIPANERSKIIKQNKESLEEVSSIGNWLGRVKLILWSRMKIGAIIKE